MTKIENLQAQARKVIEQWQLNISYKNNLGIRQEAQRSIDF